jgi:ABC-type transport system involved in multi-copper enzyme maturation permease subunit
VTPSPGRVFAALAREALADAMRRRIVPLIAVMALLSLFFVDTCTSCSPSLQVQGRTVEASQVGGVLGAAVLVVLGLWTMVLAGVLASDHLAEPLSDGSATLALARPVSRGLFALSRLAGALALALATGALLLGATAGLLLVRQGLAPGPAVAAGLACGLGCVSVGGLAMTASLYLPRVATALLVFGAVWGVALLNALGRSGAELGGWLWGVDRLGPPLASAPIVALGPWLEPLAVAGDPAELLLRGLLWAAGSALLLVVAFRRREIGVGG